RAVFEQVGVECDFQPGLKGRRRGQVIASLEHGHRLPSDRALLLLETRVLMIEVATGVAEGSAFRQEARIREQGTPGFLNARGQILAGGIGRRRSARAASQKVGQGHARSEPDSLNLMIYVAEKRDPVQFVWLLLRL